MNALPQPYRLTREDREEAIALAIAIVAARSAEGPNSDYEPEAQNNYAVRLERTKLGCLGEIAFSRMTGHRVNRSLKPGSFDDVGGWEVKIITSWDHHLILPAKVAQLREPLKVVLLVYRDLWVYCAGWCFSDQVCTPNRLRKANKDRAAVYMIGCADLQHGPLPVEEVW